MVLTAIRCLTPHHECTTIATLLLPLELFVVAAESTDFLALFLQHPASFFFAISFLPKNVLPGFIQ